MGHRLVWCEDPSAAQAGVTGAMAAHLDWRAPLPAAISEPGGGAVGEVASREQMVELLPRALQPSCLQQPLWLERATEKVQLMPRALQPSCLQQPL